MKHRPVQAMISIDKRLSLGYLSIFIRHVKTSISVSTTASSRRKKMMATKRAFNSLQQLIAHRVTLSQRLSPSDKYMFYLKGQIYGLIFNLPTNLSFFFTSYQQWAESDNQLLKQVHRPHRIVKNMKNNKIRFLASTKMLHDPR